MSSSTLHLRFALLTAALVHFGLAGSPAADKKELPPPPPPPAIPQQLRVLRGEDVDISLRIYGRRNQPITYLIRRAPHGGKLTAPKNTEREVATVRYTPPTDRKIVKDSFEYASKSTFGVSAPALVSVEIVDMAPEIISPLEKVFATRLAGTTETATIEIANHGGSVAEGEMFVNPPWRIEGSRNYRIEPNAGTAISVTFAPDQAGEFSAELRFSSQSDRVTTLRGTALAPIEAKPAALSLEPIAGTLLRAGALEVTNHTAESQTVRFASGGRLIDDGPLPLAPGQSGTLMIRTQPNDPGAFTIEFALESGALRTPVTVRAAALPGAVQIEPSKLELHPHSASTGIVGDFVLKNVGGTPVQVELIAGPDLFLSATSLGLATGGESRVTVRSDSATADAWDSYVDVKTLAGSQRMIVSARASGPRNAAAASTRRPSSKPAPNPRPARVDEFSPHNVDVSQPIDETQIVRTIAADGENLTLEWHAERSSATSFAAEIRELLIVDGQLSRRWHPHPDFRTERIGSKVRGIFAKLLPGRMYNVRVREVADDGKAGDTLFVASFTTPIPESAKRTFPWKSTLLFLGVAIVTITLWRRSHQSAPTKFDPKKTQKMV